MGLLNRRRNGDPVTEIEREIEVLQQHRAKLQDRLAAAENLLAKEIERRRLRLLEDQLDESHGEPIRDIIGRLRDDRDAIAGVLDEVGGKISDAQQRLTQEREKAKREAAAAELSGMVEAFARATDVFEASAARLFEGAYGPVMDRTPATIATPMLRDHARRLINDLLVALRQAAADAKGHAGALLVGADIVAPPTPVKPVVKPEVKRLRVMAYRSSKWTEPDGTIGTVGKFGIADVPETVARRALASKLVLEENSEQYRKLKDSNVEGIGAEWARPLPQHCAVDLDSCTTLQQEKPSGWAAPYQGTPPAAGRSGGVASVAAPTR
jgi:hypothetical protein